MSGMWLRYERQGWCQSSNSEQNQQHQHSKPLMGTNVSCCSSEGGYKCTVQGSKKNLWKTGRGQTIRLLPDVHKQVATQSPHKSMRTQPQSHPYVWHSNVSKIKLQKRRYPSTRRALWKIQQPKFHLELQEGNYFCTWPTRYLQATQACSCDNASSTHCLESTLQQWCV